MRASALALSVLLLLAQTPHARRAKGAQPGSGKRRAAAAPASGGGSPAMRGAVATSNPLAVPHYEVNVPREPPTGWREALYADTTDEWLAFTGGSRVAKQVKVPAATPGHPNPLVAFLASGRFVSEYFEQLPAHIVVVGAHPGQICNLHEVRSFGLAFLSLAGVLASFS